MIRHTVVFKLKHPKDSTEEKEFLISAQKLSSISGIKNFECLRQISKKNDYDFGLSMEFETQQEYDKYSAHPDHQNFINNRWIKEVERFLEIDYEPMGKIA